VEGEVEVEGGVDEGGRDGVMGGWDWWSCLWSW